MTIFVSLVFLELFIICEKIRKNMTNWRLVKCTKTSNFSSFDSCFSNFSSLFSWSNSSYFTLEYKTKLNYFIYSSLVYYMIKSTCVILQVLMICYIYSTIIHLLHLSIFSYSLPIPTKGQMAQGRFRARAVPALCRLRSKNSDSSTDLLLDLAARSLPFFKNASIKAYATLPQYSLLQYQLLFWLII